MAAKKKITDPRPSPPRSKTKLQQETQTAKRQTIKKGVQSATPLDKRNRAAISKGMQATQSAAAQKKDMPDFAKKLGGNPFSNFVKEVKSAPGNIINTGKSWAGTAARHAIPGAALVNVNKKGVSFKSKKEILSNLKKDGINLASMYGTAASSGRGASYAKNNTYTFGKTVVHASPQKGLKQISPRAGSKLMPTQKVAFGFDAKKSPKVISSHLERYAVKNNTPGSYYVGKVRRKDIIKPGDSDFVLSPGSQTAKEYIASRTPIKKLKEIPGTTPNLDKKLGREIAKRGTTQKVDIAKNKIQRKKQELIRKKNRKKPEWFDDPNAIVL